MPKPFINDLIKGFFLDAKKAHHMAAATLSSDDFACVIDILDIAKTMPMEDHSLSKLFLAISYYKGNSWQSLPKKLQQELLNLLKTKLETWHANPMNHRPTPVTNYFQSRNLASILLALTRLKLQWAELKEHHMDKLFLDAVYDLLPLYNFYETSITLNAFAKLNLTWRDLQAHRNLSQNLLTVVSSQLNAFSSMDLTNALMSFANMGVSWEELNYQGLGDTILAHIKANLRNFSMIDIRKILCSQLWFNFELDEETSRFLAQRVVRRVPSEFSLLERDFSRRLQAALCDQRLFIEKHRLFNVIEVDIYLPEINLAIVIDKPDHELEHQIIRKYNIQLEKVSLEGASIAELIFKITNKYELNASSDFWAEYDELRAAREEARDQGHEAPYKRRRSELPGDASAVGFWSRSETSTVTREHKEEEHYFSPGFGAVSTGNGD